MLKRLRLTLIRLLAGRDAVMIGLRFHGHLHLAPRGTILMADCRFLGEK